MSNLLLYYSILVGIIFMVWGLISLSGKKVILPRYSNSIFIMMSFIVYTIQTDFRYGFDYRVIIINLIFIGICIYIIRYIKGIYDITNLDCKVFIEHFRDELDYINISYIEENGEIILIQYSDKKIKIRKMGLNTISLDIRDFRKEEIYNDIRLLAKQSIDKSVKKYFSWNSIITLLLGVVLLFYGISVLHK